MQLLVLDGKSHLEELALEAASRGCAVIISNRGGLPETITNGIILRKLNSQNLYNSIKKLLKIKNNLRFTN